MRSPEKLKQSYLGQKEAFDLARNKRIENRNKQIAAMEEKISRLHRAVEELKSQNQGEREFETFDSFRAKALAASNNTTRKTEIS